MAQEYVKENVPPRPPVGALVLAAALAGTLAALAVAALADRALPPPLTRRGAPPGRFVAETAYEHLVNLTNIGPRVAGSYENEVAAVAVLVAAARGVAAAASAHNHVELDLQRASGAFPLAFFDGMTNVYRDVQNLVVRARGAGGRGARTALLLNCHFDTVPDSPGASDDAAGCAVGLETLRALVAEPRPLRHDVLLLLNGAEENIMQGSHAFVTQHKWAKSVRAFINIEACGAGGREVLFQAGPHDPWLVEVYATAVPHPFASSLAQELFESGVIPADTDFRIFRDFGALSGVDLAWSADGYAYHTALDAPRRLPPAALQRTGDNVLALARGLLSSESLASVVDVSSRQPVFFDVLGVVVVAARPPLALAAAAATLTLVLLRLRINATHAARKQELSPAVYVPRRMWYVAVGAAAGRAAAAGAAGCGAAAAAGLALHAAGAPMLYYARPALLAPLFAAPALGAAALVLAGAGARGGGAATRGWWAARAAADGAAAVWAAALAACAVLRLRSGFVPLLWALLPTLADLMATLVAAGGRARAGLWCGGALLPLLQTWYLALGSLAMLVPLAGRAGSPPLPIDMLMGLVVAALVLAACSWLLPLLAAARGLRTLAWALLAVGAASLALALAGGAGAAYSAERPQRLMVFHVRRELHDLRAGRRAEPQLADLYWVPELDPNTERTLRRLAEEWGPVEEANSAEECAAWVYCGAPYYLPVLRLVPRARRLHARSPPPAHAHVTVHAARTQLAPALHQLTLTVYGPSHVVVIVSPAAGARVAWSSLGAELQPGAAWARRRTYFLALHAARAPRARPRRLTLHISVPEGPEPRELAQVSVAGHDMAGQRAPDHARLLRALPAAAAATGWPVHLHLLRL